MLSKKYVLRNPVNPSITQTQWRKSNSKLQNKTLSTSVYTLVSGSFVPSLSRAGRGWLIPVLVPQSQGNAAQSCPLRRFMFQIFDKLLGHLKISGRIINSSIFALVQSV